MKWPVIAALMAGGTMGTTAILTRPPLPAGPSVAVIIPKPIVAPAIRTVTWFVAHGDERTAKLSACHDNPGVAMRDPECPNASQAVSEISYQNDVAELRKMGILR